MGRQPCCDKIGLKRGPWTIEEDHKLMNFILNNGIHCWRSVPKLAGLLRCGKSCRLRWINYLRPDLKRGGFTEMEEDQIIELHSRLGNRWSKIASHFPGRTDNEIKNHWNTRIKKRLKLLGLDPVTHKPIEQKENIDENTNKTNPHPSISGGSEEIVEIKSLENDGTKEMAKTEGKREENNKVTNWDDTAELLNNFEMLCSNLDFGSWMMTQETNTSTNSLCSSSVSMDDTSHLSMVTPLTFRKTPYSNGLIVWIPFSHGMASILLIKTFCSWKIGNKLAYPTHIKRPYYFYNLFK